MGMIALKPWPYLNRKALEDLYESSSQTHCLVQIPVPLPKEETRRYLQAIRTQMVDDKPFVCFAIMKELIGKIEASRYPSNIAEADLILKDIYRKQGYGSIAMGLFLNWMQENSWCKAVGVYIADENIDAIHLLESTGFQRTRTFYSDSLMYHEGNYQIKTVKGSEYLIKIEG